MPLKTKGGLDDGEGGDGDGGKDGNGGWMDLPPPNYLVHFALGGGWRLNPMNKATNITFSLYFPFSLV